MRHIILAIVAGILTFTAFWGGIAYATSQSGPITAPGGTYFLQGSTVSFCFNPRTGQGWLEWHTAQGTVGNCPPGDTQLTVAADPSGYPIPSPSPSASG